MHMPYKIMHIMLIMHKSSYPYCSIIIYNLRVLSIIYYNIMYAIRSYYAYSRVVVCILIVSYYAYGIGIGIRARTV